MPNSILPNKRPYRKLASRIARLSSKGFSPYYVAKILGCEVSLVCYHVKRQSDREHISETRPSVMPTIQDAPIVDGMKMPW